MSIKTKTAALAAAAILFGAASECFADNGYIISPFSLGCDFNSIAAGKLISADAESTYNKLLGAYLSYSHTAGTADIEIRSGYKDGESIINDNLTGTAGDNYIYYTPKSGNRKWPGGLFFCSTQTSNPEKKSLSNADGGLCSGIVFFEFDMRIQPGADNPSELNTAKDDARGGFITLYGWKNGADGTAASGKGVTVSEFNFCHWESDSEYYCNYWSNENKKLMYTNPIPFGEWQHFKFTVDSNAKRIKYQIFDMDGRLITSAESGYFKNADADYIMPSIDIKPNTYFNVSIDNIKVTKETFSAGEPNITVANGKITALLNIANDVYDGGGNVRTQSPLLILAAFNGDGRMIGFDVAQETVQAKISAGAPPEYKTVTAEIPEPSVPYTYNAYVWRDFNEMLPYYNHK